MHLNLEHTTGRGGGDHNDLHDFHHHNLHHHHDNLNNHHHHNSGGMDLPVAAQYRCTTAFSPRRVKQTGVVRDFRGCGGDATQNSLRGPADNGVRVFGEMYAGHGSAERGAHPHAAVFRWGGLAGFELDRLSLRDVRAGGSGSDNDHNNDDNHDDYNDYHYYYDDDHNDGNLNNVNNPNKLDVGSVVGRVSVRQRLVGVGGFRRGEWERK